MSALESYHPRSIDRTTRTAIRSIDTQAQLARVHDRHRRELAAGRISDIVRVTRHGIAGATVIAAEAELAVQVAPWAEREIVALARTGIGGIRNVISDLADPFA